MTEREAREWVGEYLTNFDTAINDFLELKKIKFYEESKTPTFELNNFNPA